MRDILDPLLHTNTTTPATNNDHDDDDDDGNEWESDSDVSSCPSLVPATAYRNNNEDDDGSSSRSSDRSHSSSDSSSKMNSPRQPLLAPQRLPDLNFATASSSSSAPRIPPERQFDALPAAEAGQLVVENAEPPADSNNCNTTTSTTSTDSIADTTEPLPSLLRTDYEKMIFARFGYLVAMLALTLILCLNAGSFSSTVATVIAGYVAGTFCNRIMMWMVVDDLPSAVRREGASFVMGLLGCAFVAMVVGG